MAFFGSMQHTNRSCVPHRAEEQIENNSEILGYMKHFVKLLK